MEPQNVIYDHKTDDLPPQMIIFNTIIPILMHFFTFTVQSGNIAHIRFLMVVFDSFKSLTW